MELTEDDLGDIQDEAWDARAQWYNIGLGLRLPTTDLDVIDKDKGDIEAKFRCMLLKWLRSGKHCTWEALCKALSTRSVNHSVLAATIRQSIASKREAESSLLSQAEVSPGNSSAQHILLAESSQVHVKTRCSEPTSLDLSPSTSTQDASLGKPLQDQVDVQTRLDLCPNLPAAARLQENTSSITERTLSLKADINLREYQKELADPGVRGKNYVLVAPTGAGKTLIAGYIIMHHLKKMWEEERRGKVAFITPTRQLAFQQSKQLQDYILGIMAIENTGASGKPMCPLIQSDLVDVIVCTAGKIRRELTTKNIQITDFSMIVADECHHAGRSSNYSDVMEFYIKLKLSTSCDHIHLPQVIGMTASPGAGKGRAGLVTVMDHHISLCATLDATGGLVTVTDNVGELEHFSKSPKTYLEVEDERDPNDRFNACMYSAMEQLETFIGGIPCLTRGSPKYESWLQNEKEAAENRVENETARISILDQLIVYSQSLMTYRDFRFDDALTVLEDIEEVQNRSSLEILLNAVHKGLMDKLTTLPKVPNPLLVHMESILLEQYLRNPQSKGIFFVRAIKHTKYVTSWIKSSSALSRIIRAAPITGHSRGGMEQSEQLRVLDAFRTGAYNLLASTSVLEEGLDVPECNYVIRYQNVSNEIAQVQAKGRARAENSRIYTVVSTHSNRDYWYLVQEEKQRIVNISIAALQMVALEQQICFKQRSFIEECDRKNQQMKLLRSKWPQSENVEVLCKKCNVLVCKGSDIFTYSLNNVDPHYVIPSKTFSDKYEKRDHDRPEISEDFVKPYRIYCRSVNCRNQWGIIGLWRETGFKFPVMKCEKFLFKYHGATQRFRKWRDIWFEVHSIQDWVEFEDDILDN